MKSHIEHRGRLYEVDLSTGGSIAIPLTPGKPQPRFFIDQDISARPLAIGDFIGDMHQGGSCNAEVITLAPHCHGTHTEGIGHIEEAGYAVQDVVGNVEAPALLITVEPGPDQRITLGLLKDILDEADLLWAEALVIRTLPNDEGKKARDYGKAPNYPVLTVEAITWLALKPLRHLLLDSPSLDAADDNGALTNHRLWWTLSASDEEWSLDPRGRSVTEMVFIPEAITDGRHWLSLSLSPLRSDACTSNPILYPMKINSVSTNGQTQGGFAHD